MTMARSIQLKANRAPKYAAFVNATGRLSRRTCACAASWSGVFQGSPRPLRSRAAAKGAIELRAADRKCLQGPAERVTMVVKLDAWSLALMKLRILNLGISASHDWIAPLTSFNNPVS